MASVNKVILIGNVGKDPDIRYTSDNKAIATVSVATSESWKDKDGNKQEKTEWHRVVMFGKLAEITGEYVKKGGQVYIEGRLQTQKWIDKDGQDRYTTEIIADRMQMLGSRQTVETANEPEPAKAKKPNAGSKFDDLEDSIPF